MKKRDTWPTRIILILAIILLLTVGWTACGYVPHSPPQASVARQGINVDNTAYYIFWCSLGVFVTGSLIMQVCAARDRR